MKLLIFLLLSICLVYSLSEDDATVVGGPTPPATTHTQVTNLNYKDVSPCACIKNNKIYSVGYTYYTRVAQSSNPGYWSRPCVKVSCKLVGLQDKHCEWKTQVSESSNTAFQCPPLPATGAPSS